MTVQQLARMTDPHVDDLIETLIGWTHQVVGDEEIVVAREQFFVDAGKVFHEDSVYDARMSYFFDSLLFERSLPGGSAKPLATAFEHLLQSLEAASSTSPGLSEATLRRLRALGDFRHSLFEITKLGERGAVLADLIQGGKLTVEARPGETFRGLERKTLAQGFIYPLDDARYLSHGLILHPRRANRVIRRLLRHGQKSENFSRKSFLARLATLQLRHFRHRHVDPKAIYAADGR